MADRQVTSTSQKERFEPTFAEVREALGLLAGDTGTVPVGAARRLCEERGWRGRLIDVLAVLTEAAGQMAYLAGGRRPEAVATWLALWAESSLSLDEIRLIVADRGWDPEPFAALAKAGLLERTLVHPDGSPRVIHGELAGGWVSDELALADDAEVVRRVLEVLGDESTALAEHPSLVTHSVGANRLTGAGALGPHPLPQEEFDAIFAMVPRLTVEVVVTSSDGVFLTRRQSGPCRGLWHLPGGTVRLGEPLTAAVRRVAREELGLDAVAEDLLGYIEYPSHLERGLGWPVGIAFRARPSSAGAALRRSPGLADWFSQLPLEMHDEQRAFITAHVLGSVHDR